MSIKFQVKRANTTTWSSINPTLDSGEFGFETNTNKLKIGNGSNTWNTLSYIASGVIDFDTVSSVNSATISSSVNHIRTAGYYTTGDEGGANYARYSTNGSTPAHGGYITSNGGQYVWEIDEVQPNIKQFGAKDDANFDSRSSIQNAINFGKSVFIPNGSYTVLDTLFCNNSGQLIQGESREKAVIFANGNFNTTTSNGIFVLRSYEPGPELRSFTIRCDQPNTSSRASLVSYPPAIYGDRDLFGSFTGQARTRIINMRIERAKTGIDLRGNAGGSTIDDLQISSFDYAIRLDESVDSVRLLSVHHWPFGLGTLTQLNNIFFDTDNIGLEIGRVDDLHVEGGLFIGGGNQMQFVSTEGGAGTFGRVTGTMFDTYGQLSCNNFNGFLTFQGCGFSLLPNNRSAIKLTGGSGSIRLTGCRFNNNEPLTVPLVEQNGASNLIMVGNIFNLPGSGEMTVIKTGSSVGDAAEAIIADNYFDIPPNVNFATKNVVDVGTGTRITFTGNRIRDKGTGAGNFLNIVQDNHHVIIGNAFLGWNLVLPESFNDIVIRHNSSLPSSDIRSNRLVGREYVARYAAEANSGGNSIFSHGISDLNKKTIMTQAFFKEGSGNTKPCVIDYIDGTNIRVTGANANSNLVVTVVYTAVNDPRWG